jgi:hypothetical protein
LDFEGVVADEISALLNILAHQDAKESVRLTCII